MFRNRLKSGFTAGDTCLAYKYHDRKGVKSAGDLETVRIREVISSDKNGIMVGGTDAGGENFTGFAVYRLDGDFVETGEGLKYMGCYKNGGEYGRCLRKISQDEYLRLGLIFMLKKEAEIAVDIFPGMLFTSEDEATRFVSSCHFKKASISLSGVEITINGDRTIFKDYRIYAGDMEYKSETSGKEFFEKMFQNYSPSRYIYQASFSLRLVSYEFSPVLVPKD